MTALVRTLVPGDIPAVTVIQEQAVLDGLASFALSPMSEAEISQKFITLQENGYPCLVAVVDDKLAGFANAGPYHMRPGYRWTVENSIYLDPQFHRRGIGFQLLDSLINSSEELGFRQMIAVIGDSNNTGSIKLHYKCGFEMTGILKSVGYKYDQWLDVVVMQKALGEGDATHPSPEAYPGNLYKN